MAAADGSEWIQEAVVRFLQGPCYTAPLMGFIDEKCTIFDTEEENKFEYSSVHEDFKKTVETLIADFLEEIGVTGEEFVAAVGEGASSRKLSSFVLSSILTVDDFLQFKAMMVKRNMDLTEEVIRALEAGEISCSTASQETEDKNETKQSEHNEQTVKGTSVPSPSSASAPAPGVVAEPDPSPPQTKVEPVEHKSRENAQAAPGTSDDADASAVDDELSAQEKKEKEELARALAMSKEQFAVDEERRSKPGSSGVGSGSSSSEEAELSLAMRRSLLERCRIETERAELEQAIALSLALEAERARLEMEYSKEEELQMERSRMMEAKTASAPPPDTSTSDKSSEVVGVTAKTGNDGGSTENLNSSDSENAAGETAEAHVHEEDAKLLETEDEGKKSGEDIVSNSDKDVEETQGTEVIVDSTAMGLTEDDDDTAAGGIADATITDTKDKKDATQVKDIVKGETKENSDNDDKEAAPAEAVVVPSVVVPAIKKGRAQPVTLPALPLKEQKQLESMRSKATELKSATSATPGTISATSLHAAPRPLHTLRRGSGFSSSSAATTTSTPAPAGAKPGAGGMHLHEVRAAASAAASSQKALLVRRAAAAQTKTKAAGLSGIIGDRDKSQAEFFAQQRRELVARKARERQAELDRFLDTERANNKENKPRASPTRNVGSAIGKEKSGLLQAELAKTVKHELIARLATEGASSS